MTEARPATTLLAGAWGGEREPPGRSGGERDWHLPAHVRQPAETRRRLAEQVGVGANAIVAATFWTSRPALARYGEARRAREWTELAVRLAREAVEEAGRDVLVCGSILPVSEDFEAHAGTLADAGVDVLLVEQMGTLAEARAANLAAAATGLPVWSGAQLGGGEWLGEWAEAVEPAAPERLLVYGSARDAARSLEELGRMTTRALGACLTEPAGAEDAALLLERGATVLGLASGATPEALRTLRQAIDARLEADRTSAEDDRREWLTWVERAAAWAPGGLALWLGHEPDHPLPAGFDWTMAPAEDAGRLPQHHFRLIVVGPSNGQPAGEHLLRLLEEGGVLLGALGAAAADSPGRILDRSDDPPLTILRRE